MFVFLGYKEPTMDVPESSTKSLDSFDCVHKPQPAPLATSGTISGDGLDLTRFDPIYLEEDGSFKPYDPEYEKGTTALAFTFKKGIIVAVDHSDKSLEWPKNVFQLNSHMLATISGGSESLLEPLQKECFLQEQKGRKISVDQVLDMLTRTLAEKEELSIGILIAVWNNSNPAVYRINGLGHVVRDDILATGCGSDARYVVMDIEMPCPYPNTHGRSGRYGDRCKLKISVKKAAEVARRAICVAVYDAPVCGETVSVFHLGSGGCRKIIEDDIEEWQNANIELPRRRVKIFGKGWSE